MITRSTAARLSVAGVSAALMLAVAAPSAEARGGRTAAAAFGGFAAGALVGSAVASGYHHPGYAYHPGYYHRGYAYGPAYGPYAYAPAPAYRQAPAYAAPAYAYDPGYAAYAYAPGYSRDYQIAYDSAGNPIYASELGGYCTFGAEIDNEC